MTTVLTDASIGIGLPQLAVPVCGVSVQSTVTDGPSRRLVARANRTPFFRRALKIVNGGLGSLPNGLTIAAENPVYVQGNYNSDGQLRSPPATCPRPSSPTR